MGRVSASKRAAAWLGFARGRRVAGALSRRNKRREKGTGLAAAAWLRQVRRISERDVVHWVGAR